MAKACSIEPPAVPRIPSPVLLGQTIALDLKGTWWTRWWHKRRGYTSFATDFADMIQAETEPIVEGLKNEHAASIRDTVRDALQSFLDEQRGILAKYIRCVAPASAGCVTDE